MIKIKIEFAPKMYKISGTLGIIYINDIYSKKEVNFGPENHLMHNYFNLNYLKGWHDIVENTWDNYFLIFNQLSQFFFCFCFLIFQNQSAAENVIQLIKTEKPNV